MTTACHTLRAALKTDCWNSDIVKPFRNIKDEITIDYMNDILLRGMRIIVPESLQKHTIELAHQGHQDSAKRNHSASETRVVPWYGQTSERGN